MFSRVCAASCCAPTVRLARAGPHSYGPGQTPCSPRTRSPSRPLAGCPLSRTHARTCRLGRPRRRQTKRASRSVVEATCDARTALLSADHVPSGSRMAWRHFNSFTHARTHARAHAHTHTHTTHACTWRARTRARVHDYARTHACGHTLAASRAGTEAAPDGSRPPGPYPATSSA